MFNQLLTPLGDSLLLSFLVAALPIVVVLVSLGVVRRPAWQSSLAGLIVASSSPLPCGSCPSGSPSKRRGGRRVRAVARDVDRVQRAASL